MLSCADFKGIKWHERNSSKTDDRFSVVHKFLIISAKALHNSVVLSPKWVDINNLFQTLLSSLSGLSASVEPLLIAFTSGLPGIITTGSALCLVECFRFNCCAAFFHVKEKCNFSFYESADSLIGL